jgi:flagellar biosynthesis protein FlhF
MKLKSFFANSIEEAIRLARHELGPEAMLVNSKRTAVEARHLGAYEVVVCAEAPEPAAKSAPQERHRPQPAASLPVDKLAHDVSELKQRMEKLALVLARSGSGMAGVAFDPELSQIFNTLADAELDTELAYDIVGSLKSPVPAGALPTELAGRVRVDTQLGSPGAPTRIVALVGPPGAGKTSALVKLAVQYGIAVRKPVQILTTDTYRIAAAEELRSYAAILGLGYEVLETPADLAEVLDGNTQNDHHNNECSKNSYLKKDLILIDTPGLSRREMETSEDLAQVLAAHPGVDTHLVLPASMRAADLKRVADEYAIFRPRKLLFTRLDETQTFGPILSESIRMGKPLSFFARGQRIPEDLEPATVGLVLDLILRSLPERETRFGVVAA